MLCVTHGISNFRHWLLVLDLSVVFQDQTTENTKVLNAHILIDDKGEIRGVYRKAHLFDVDIKGGAVLKESEYVNPGMKVIKPIESPVGNIALQIVSFLQSQMRCKFIIHFNIAVIVHILFGRLILQVLSKQNPGCTNYKYSLSEPIENRRHS